MGERTCGCAEDSHRGRVNYLADVKGHMEFSIVGVARCLIHKRTGCAVRFNAKPRGQSGNPRVEPHAQSALFKQFT